MNNNTSLKNKWNVKNLLKLRDKIIKILKQYSFPLNTLIITTNFLYNKLNFFVKRFVDTCLPIRLVDLINFHNFNNV